MSKKKIALQLTELDQVYVSYISLVKHGANRIPFKIIKTAREEGMLKTLNLANIFGFKKSEEAPKQSAVVGVVVLDTAVASVSKAIEGMEGIEIVETKKADEGLSAICFKSDIDEDSILLMKANDNVVLMLENVEKGFYSWPEGSSFSENMNQAGFYPGLRMATDVMLETVYNIMDGAEGNPAEAVGKALTEYSDYVQALVGSIPVEAFKSFENLQAIALEAPVVDLTDSEEASAGEESVEKTEELEGEESVEKAEGVEEEESVEKSKSTEAPAGFDPAALLTEMKNLVSGVETALTQKLDDTSKALDQKVDGLTARIDKNEEAINGTVIGGEQSGDRTQTQKTEGKQEVAKFDSALRFPGFDD